MKSFSVLLVFILAAFSAVAQTDTNAIVVPADTNAPAAPPAQMELPFKRTRMQSLHRLKRTRPPPNRARTRSLSRPTPWRPPRRANVVGRLHSGSLAAQPRRANRALRPANLALQLCARLMAVMTRRSMFPASTITMTPARQFQNGHAHARPRPPTKTVSIPDLSGSLPWGMTYDFSGNVTDTHIRHNIGSTQPVRTTPFDKLQRFGRVDSHAAVAEKFLD